MKTLSNILFLLQIVLIMTLVVSCKDDSEQELKLSRKFQPAVFDITSSQTNVIIKWDPSLFTEPGKVDYVFEVSKDLDFSVIDYSLTTSYVEVTLYDTDLDIKTDYYSRVKALGISGQDDSHWLISEAWQILGEIFIKPIPEYNVLEDEVTLQWDVKPSLVRFVLTPQGGSPVESMIDDDEALAGEKVISGLLPGTNYVAELFSSDGVSKGAVSFTTKDSYDGANIIDLRDIVGDPTILADTLQKIPSGSVVLLKRGEVYTIMSTQDIDRSVTIVSGAAYVEQLARIDITSNFNLKEFSAIDSVIFKDLELIGGSFNSHYMFNINKEGSIGTVRFENCRGHALRGWMRMQTGGAGTHVQDLIVNNCVIDSLREYGIATTNNLNSIANIRITNCTVYNARRFINHGSAGSNSILVENCTFHNLPTGGLEGSEPSNYFISLGSNNVATPVIIRNCIFSKGWNEGDGDYIRGLSAGGATTFSVVNCYATGDHHSTTSSAIPGLLSYPGISTSVFVNPDLGNFHIKDSSFPGRTSSGDPRWRL